MLNDVQRLLPESARFEARVSDLEDIEELVRVYRSSVLRHAWWLLKDRDLAETVTQDCFMRAFNSRALYRGQCSVRTWLLAIPQTWSATVPERTAFDSGNRCR